VHFCGVIMGATVSFEAGRWFISVQVETGGEREPARSGTVAGVDLGSRTLATIAGENNAIESIPGPKARRRLPGRIKRQQRRISLQSIVPRGLGKGRSRRQFVRQLRLSSCVRVWRTFAAHDCGFHEIRRRLRYKAAMRGGRITIGDRFYPSTRICSCCGHVTGRRREEMHVEQWI
jgi:putative transposase